MNKEYKSLLKDCQLIDLAAIAKRFRPIDTPGIEAKKDFIAAIWRVIEKRRDKRIKKQRKTKCGHGFNICLICGHGLKGDRDGH